MDLSRRREDAVSQYKVEALAVRDGEQDTRIAAERGLKKAYAPVQGHSCEQDASDEGAPAAAPATDAKPVTKPSGDSPFAPGKPGTTPLPSPVPETPAPATPSPQL